MKLLNPASSKFARAARLLGLVFGADHHTTASASTDIVAHRSGQIERRDAI